jgi:Ca-activated chloride channel family protein
VEAPLALDVQVFPSPNRRGFHLLSLAVEARLPRGPAALRVFAVDLRSADEAIARCARAIRSWRGADRVALVTVGPRPALAVPPATPGGAALDAALAALVSTSGGALLDGLRVAFEAAAEIEGDRREVVLCAPQRPEDLLAATRLASRYAALGIRLHLIAAGPRYDPDALGALAEAGRGSLRYLDPRGDLELTTEPVADGLKLEVRFDPRFVARYRRIGWDGRRLGEVDLDDQRRPGGRLFGGQSARVLYEVELAGSWSSAAIAEVQLRGEPGVDLARPILGERIAPRWEAADPRHRLAALAGLFGEKLRGAYWARNLGYRDLADRLAALDLPAARSLEVLVAQAERIDRRGDRFEADRPIGEMTFQEVPVLGPPAPGGP